MEDASKNDLAEVGQVIKERWKVVSSRILVRKLINSGSHKGLPGGKTKLTGHLLAARGNLIVFYIVVPNYTAVLEF